jgi:hypothetical protein
MAKLSIGYAVNLTIITWFARVVVTPLKSKAVLLKKGR